MKWEKKKVGPGITREQKAIKKVTNSLQTIVGTGAGKGLLNRQVHMVYFEASSLEVTRAIHHGGERGKSQEQL